MKIVAVVPIKLNNERLPGKNTKLLNGKPLIEYILTTLNNVENIEEKYVFCSDESIISYLPQGIRFLKRDKSLDSSSANFTQIFLSFMSMVDADIYVYTHATSPFLTKDTILKCIQSVASGEYDSAFTAIAERNFMWIDGMPNYDIYNLPRTQDINPILLETSGVYVFTKKIFSTSHRRIGDKPYVCEVTNFEAVDIDEPFDFEFAEYLAKVQLNEQYK